MEITKGRTLKFKVPDSKNKYILVIIDDVMVNVYTGFENIGICDHAFGEENKYSSDDAIAREIETLYNNDYFSWAHYNLGGERVEEIMFDRYLNEIKDTVKFTFDEWVKQNYDEEDFIR